MHSSESKTSGFAPINDAKLYYETAGEGNPLLFIHAGVGDGRMWDHQFAAFARTHFVIRFDLRGFGQSRRTPGTFAYYEDVAALLRHVNVPTASVIAASFGGAVALDFTLAYPEMVTALILVSPALGGFGFESPEMEAFWSAEDEALERGDLAAATELNLKMWVDGFNREASAVNPQVREQVRVMQHNIFSQPDVAGVTEKELTPPAIEQLPTITAPTLVIAGDKDVPEFLSLSRLIAEKIPGSRHVTMSGAAHLPSMEQPEAFNQLVGDFLR